jgi:hypothetical protein
MSFPQNSTCSECSDVFVSIDQEDAGLGYTVTVLDLRPASPELDASLMGAGFIPTLAAARLVASTFRAIVDEELRGTRKRGA